MLSVLACSRALRVYVLACSRPWRVCVLACLRACVLGVLTCLACLRFSVLGVFTCVLACYDEIIYFLTCIRTWWAFLSYLLYISVLKFKDSYSEKFVCFVKLNLFLIDFLIPTYETIWNQFKGSIVLYCIVNLFSVGNKNSSDT